MVIELPPDFKELVRLLNCHAVDEVNADERLGQSFHNGRTTSPVLWPMRLSA
jgi:hypothetical protein